MIFSVELSPWPPPSAQAAEESGEIVDPRCALLAAIYRLEGAPYLLGNPVFFGFRNLPTPEALKCARTARRECARHAPDDVKVAVSCSTVAPKECTEALTRPWDFLRTDELREALTQGILFHRLEPL
jgi:hypothetical protein